MQTTINRSDFGSCDHIVISGDSTWIDSSIWISTNKSGSSENEIAIIEYPGEQVISQLKNGEVIQLNSGAGYITLANFRMVGGTATNNSQGLNSNDNQTNIRLVNTYIEILDTDPVFGVHHIAMSNAKLLGNTVFSDMAPIYACCGGNNYLEIGWHEHKADGCPASCRGIQLRSTSGSGNQNVMIHDNIIHNFSDPRLKI